MRYLTYDEYISVGGTLDEAAFVRVVDRACGYIDGYTQKRLRGVTVLSDGVKACVRDLCECISAHDGTTAHTIVSRSQSAGSVSESVSYSEKSTDEMHVDARYIIYDYLWEEEDDNGTPLLYKGRLK